MAHRWGNSGNSDRLYFLGLQNHHRWWLQPWNLKTLAPWKKSYDQPRRILKSRDITLPTKVHLVKAMVFPVVMWDYKESWGLKNWCFWTVVLKKTLESPLDCKKIQPVHPKGNQSWVVIGSTDAEAESTILWPPDVKSWLTGKHLDAGEDWRQEVEGDDRGLHGWMPSLTQWTWVWASSGSWWWTGKSGMLQCMRSKRVRHAWATNRTAWSDLNCHEGDSCDSGTLSLSLPMYLFTHSK